LKSVKDTDVRCVSKNAPTLKRRGSILIWQMIRQTSRKNIQKTLE